MDDNGRVRYCPRCRNQELDLDSEYCQICGLTLYNTCIGDWQHDMPKHKNKSNARFCKICGLPTTYNHQNILRPYSVIMKHGIMPTPPLQDTDGICDRYIKMSIIADNSLVTAENIQADSEIMNEDKESAVGLDIPF